MSLDLYLAANKCESCGNQPEEVIHINHTYNTSNMWLRVYPNASGMVDIEGLSGAEAAPILENAIHEMIRNKVDFLLMNPPNGWGSYETFLLFLRQSLSASQDNPDLIWQACR